MSALARNTDPAESHAAARSVNEQRDLALVLEAARTLGFGHKYTAWEIGLVAGRSEGTPETDFRRLDSLRRRVSDLRQLGWIKQTGQSWGTALFTITLEGWRARP